jgi:hypothetical protein
LALEAENDFNTTLGCRIEGDSKAEISASQARTLCIRPVARRLSRLIGRVMKNILHSVSVAHESPARFSNWMRSAIFSAVALAVLSPAARAADWDTVQKLKVQCLSLTAQHAMEQQKTSAAPAIPIAFPSNVVAGGNLKIAAKSAQDLSVELTASPKVDGRSAAEFIRIKLPKPLDMISRHSGLALLIQTEQGSSPEVRLGLRLLAADGKSANIQPIMPALSPWGSQKREIYFDWAFLDYAKAKDAVAVLKAVDTIEITAASAKRAPQSGAAEQARSASFILSDLRLVDYLKGSYDPSRRWLKFDTAAGKWVAGGSLDLTLQHRTQEVTGIVAAYGGEAGVASAIDSLDMAARTQCWDGSFLDGRRGAVTVASGEYTFGFTLYGLLCAYTTLEKARCPLLDDKITIGADTMTRREFYQRMFYRGAMARTAALPSAYRDDIIDHNTLITGANRVLGYAMAMRMIADVLTNPAKKRLVLEKYRPIMQEIADAQGKFSGGFPLLGEGDIYDGRGIHYDAGYTRTHMDWLVLGARRTGDPLLVQILRRYQDVFEAAMDSEGTGLLPMISERHQPSGPVQLILSDATGQVGMQYHLPVIAQWGYNCGIHMWPDGEQRSTNHFRNASSARGYTLGAHMSILVDDMEARPVPKDLGYLFPRQFPVWSSRLYSKDGKLVRTSHMYIHPNGELTSDFRIQVGEFPVTVGVPVAIKSPKGVVVATAGKLSGWPKLLPEGAAIEIGGDVSAKGRIGQPFLFTLNKETHILISGPAVTLPPEAGGEKVPFRAELTLTPQGSGLPVELTVLRGTTSYTYKAEPQPRP